jgi:hypothetical protein
MTKHQLERTVESWLKISMTTTIYWVEPIWTAYRKARAAGLVPDIPHDLSQLAIHLSTRLDMLPHVLARIESEAKEIYKVGEQVPEEKRCRPRSKCYAIEVDDKLTRAFLLDVDSLLFEFESCCELITKFVAKVHTLAGDDIEDSKAGEKVKEIVVAAGTDISWYTALGRDRSHFIHNAAPWLAIDFSEPSSPDILIMKENLREFSDAQKFVRLGDLRRVVGGFIESLDVLQTHLIEFLTHLAN